jgi:hypothetical protein
MTTKKMRQRFSLLELMTVIGFTMRPRRSVRKLLVMDAFFLGVGLFAATGGQASGLSAQPVPVNGISSSEGTSRAQPALYIDCINGLDTNLGNTEAAPIKSLSKISGWAGSAPAKVLKIHLKRGTRCQGSINLRSDQLNRGNGVETRVIVDAYGDPTVPRPEISGSVARKLTWSPAGTVVSRAGIEIPSLTSNPDLVKTHLGFAFGDFIVDGQLQTLAQYPEADTLVKVPVTQRILGNGTTIKDIIVADVDQILDYGMEPDGQALIRLAEWSWYNHGVDSYNSSTNQLTLSTPLYRWDLTYAPLGFGIVLQGYLAALSQPGEWYYDSSSGYLYHLPLAGAPPATAEFSLPGQGTVTIEYTGKGSQIRFEMRDVRIVHSQLEGITLLNLKQATIEGVEILKSSGDGIFAFGVDSIVIQDCSIEDTGTEGINIRTPWVPNLRYDVSIARNSLRNIGVRFNTNRIAVTGNAINVGYWDADIYIASNRIESVGGNGVSLMMGQGRLEVRDNYVEDFNSMIQDSAAYYLAYKNSGILGNYGSGEKDGFFSNNMAKDASTRGGIHSSVNLHLFMAYYLDWASSDVLLEDNVAVNACGIVCFYNNGGSRNTYRNNVMYGPSRHGGVDFLITMEMDWLPELPVYKPDDIVWESNKCYDLEGTPLECKWSHYTGFDPNR